MNDHKIAFIACVNDEEEFAEALYYIERLHVPQGYETDVIAVREAPSMAAGYNAAMAGSDAKYKIYIHQDTFLVCPDMLSDMLRTFQSDAKIGILGVIGSRMWLNDMVATCAWNSGEIYVNSWPTMLMEYEKPDKTAQEVMSLDGVFLATQYDVQWREDLFDGWHFYDISQCFEFQLQGKKAVIPYQESIWCYHDCRENSMEQYECYRKRLIREYEKRFPIRETAEFLPYAAEYAKLQERFLETIEHMINEGKTKEAIQTLMDNSGYPRLKEMELICRILSWETKEPAIREPFYREGMHCEELYIKFNRLRHLLKRIEFGCAGEADKKEFAQEYSACAAAMMILFYAVSRNSAYEKILEIYQTREPDKAQAFRRLQELFIQPVEQKKLLHCLKNEKMTENDRRLAVVKDLTKESMLLWKKEDTKDTVLLFETYTKEALEQVKEAEAVCGTLVQWCGELHAEVYTRYREVVVYGDNREDYVRFFYGTHIPVTWYRESGEESFLAGGNIEIK